VCDAVLRLRRIGDLVHQYAGSMRLIFIDESARDDRYYFFGALIVEAAALRSIEHGLDAAATDVARSVPRFDPETEFHAVEMFHGKSGWGCVPPQVRVRACMTTATVLARSTASFVFRGIDLRAHRAHPVADARPVHLLTLAHLLEAVDEYLEGADPSEQLGLVLADDHHAADGARRSLRDVKTGASSGWTAGPLTRIADTLYFGPSHESRLLQAADFATYFLNRDRTVPERDHRAARATARIVRAVRSITVEEVVWCPPDARRPARGRGVGWVREA
jgi:hypothetical protein